MFIALVMDGSAYRHILDTSIYIY